jgi:hypothetical protein
MDKEMKFYPIIIAAILLGLFVTGCSELQTDIPQPQEVRYHPEGIANPNSPHWHGTLIKDQGWDMRDCQQCHGGAFAGGVYGPTCKNCHTQEAGPAACNTCHGDFGNPSRIAPPRDLNDNISSNVRGVGAHVQHLYERVMGARTPCGSCHNVPQTLYQEGHINGLPAEVVLKGRSTLFGAVDATYDAATGTCSNTYCHGNFVFYRDSADAINRFAYTADRMIGTNKTVTWTNVGQQEAECGSCHGLPPIGHIQVPLTACYQCHYDIVDEQGRIINTDLHINGVPNVRGN